MRAAGGYSCVFFTELLHVLGMVDIFGHTRKFFHEGFRLLIRIQRPGIDSHCVRLENLERLAQKIDQKASLGRFLEHFEIGRPKILR